MCPIFSCNIRQWRISPILRLWPRFLMQELFEIDDFLVNSSITMDIFWEKHKKLGWSCHHETFFALIENSWSTIFCAHHHTFLLNEEEFTVKFYNDPRGSFTNFFSFDPVTKTLFFQYPGEWKIFVKEISRFYSEITIPYRFSVILSELVPQRKNFAASTMHTPDHELLVTCNRSLQLNQIKTRLRQLRLKYFVRISQLGSDWNAESNPELPTSILLVS